MKYRNFCQVLLFVSVLGQWAELTAKGDTEDSKEAYALIASVSTKLLIDSRTGIAAQESLPMTIARLRETYQKLNKLTNIEPDLADVIKQISAAKAKMDAVVNKLNALPHETSFSSELIIEAGYLAHGDFDKISEELKKDDSHNDVLRSGRQDLINAALEYEAGVQLFPGIVKRWSGPVATNNDVFYIFQGGWGGGDHSDWLKVANRSDSDFHNCTVVVTLTSASGEVVRNVHFIKEWPQQTYFTAFYDLGIKINDEYIEKSTFKDVALVVVDVYSDEATLLNLSTPFTRDQMTVRLVNDNLKAISQYRPFSKGLIFDQQRSVIIGWKWDRMAYLPKGQVVVTLKNNEHVQRIKKEFDQWPAGKSFKLSFENVDWEPVEWSAEFNFDGTSARFTFNWTR